MNMKDKIYQILLVEDDIVLARTISDLLEESGFIVKFSNDVNGAINYLEKHIPDVIISDLMMPKKNGLQFFNDIKKNPKYNTIPFIIITANSVLDKKLDALQEGVNDYIIKPFIFKELVFKIHNLTELKKNIEIKYKIYLIKTDNLKHSDTLFFRKLDDLIFQNINTTVRVNYLAKSLGVSKSALEKKVNKVTKKNISRYIREYRLEFSIKLIENGVTSIKVIYNQSGFNSASYYSRCFKDYMGITPKAFISNFIK
jgi:DNA-binding response OmpR family regulator